MSWVDDYKKKLVSAEEAVAAVKSGDRVYISGNAATPYVLMKSLASQKDALKDVELVHVLLLGDDPLSKPDMEGHFRHNSLFVGPADRKAINEGRADYVPIFLHQIPLLFYSGQMPLHAAVLHVSPPDEHGFMSLGVEVLASKAAAETATQSQQLGEGAGPTRLLPASESAGEPIMLRRQITHALRSNPDQVKQMFLSWIEEKE